MKTVYEYLDYRDYLRDYFERRKETSPWYSFKVMGEGVGLDQSQVYRILHGELHISRAALPRFIEYLHIEGTAAEYFALLVRFARSKRESERRDLFGRILELRGSRCRTLEAAQYELYREWHLPVVRALLGILEVRDDLEELAASCTPAIAEEAARNALATLERLGLAARGPDGVWRTVEKNLTTGREYTSLVVRGYQAESLDLAKKSLDRHARELRDISVTNVAVDEAAFRDIAELMRECRRQVQRRVEAVNQPDRVLRLAHALFPVALTGKNQQPLPKAKGAGRK